MAHNEGYNEQEIISDISKTIDEIMSEPNFSYFEDSAATQRLNSIKELRQRTPNFMLDATQKMPAVKP